MSSDEQPQEGTSDDQNTDTSEETSPDTGTDNTADSSQEELSAEALATELKRARREAANFRKRAQAAEKAAEQARVDQLSEHERAIEDARREGRAERDAQTIAAEIRAAAAAAGAIDPADVVALIDRSAVSVDADGTPVGVTDAVAQLLDEKPHLVRRPEPRFTIDGAGGQQGAPALPTFTRSQLRDNAFYRANADAIRAAANDGRIVDDT